MRRFALTTALLIGLALPGAASAQGIEGIMQGIRDGGGWVSVPIVAGAGSIRTVPLPTFGLTLSGCVHVWGGHSGSWHIRARDTVGDGSLEGSPAPGEGVRFTHTFGVRSQLEFDFAWSEPRDTTLMLWIGIDDPDDDRDACTPVR